MFVGYGQIFINILSQFLYYASLTSARIQIYLTELLCNLLKISYFVRFIQSKSTRPCKNRQVIFSNILVRRYFSQFYIIRIYFLILYFIFIYNILSLLFILFTFLCVYLSYKIIIVLRREHILFISEPETALTQIVR